MAALDELRVALKKRIRVLRKSCMPLILANGVKSLPDEILCLIFEAGHIMTVGCTFATTVSHVSQRFREVSLRTPLLWTRISVLSSSAQNLAFISHTGGIGLDVSTGVPWTSRHRVESFFEILRPTTPRWSHLRLYRMDDWVTMELLGLAELPNLQFLHHGCKIGFVGWKLPRLSRISGFEHSFTPGSSFVPSQLTSFEMKLDTVTVDVISLYLTLRSMVNLEALSLTVRDRSKLSISDDIIPIRDPRSVHINTLQLNIRDMTCYQVVEPMYYALSYLSASSVQITLDNLPDQIPLTYGEDIAFPYGSKIHIRLSQIATSYYPWNSSGLLAELVHGCPIAETISVEAPTTGYILPRSYSEDRMNAHSLREVQFKYCDRLTEDEVEDLVAKLMLDDEGIGLQSLEILYCKGISEDFLLHLSDIPGVGQKLKWTL
ncbi:hypothetical protein BD410DRAFT_868305 [Rickenella mellea]|uniref:Uncharacterized protein n=1 Tax=Rickenella mellea TaxID=50990 RepID=A0A4Y7Q1U9_9AGAM|nr:hypothetical protein BD410DRAFT_868305 [Rickenella mellea]